MSGLVLFAAGALTLGCVYAIWAMILNYEAGWAGLWDLGVAGIVAVGAYTYVILVEPVGISTTQEPVFAPELPIWIGVLGAGLAGLIAAAIIGIPSLRLRGEYFLITTFAFAEMIRQLTITQGDLTRGVSGFASVDRPLDTLVEPRDYNFLLLALVAVVMVGVFLLLRRLGTAPHGRALRALRDNEPVALSLGKNVARYRLRAFLLAGGLMAATAPLYVWYIRSVFPQLFTANITFTVWTAVVIGGIGGLKGPALGAIALIVATEALVLIPVPTEYATQLAGSRPLLLGLALILVLRLRPEGLSPERKAFATMSERVERGSDRAGALTRIRQVFAS